MKKIYLVASLATVFTGCAQMSPVKAKQISLGVYRIETSGKVSAPTALLEAKVDKKATTLCGAAGFEYKGKGALRSDDAISSYNGTKKKSKYVAYTQVIECKSN